MVERRTTRQPSSAETVIINPANVQAGTPVNDTPYTVGDLQRFTPTISGPVGPLERWDRPVIEDDEATEQRIRQEVIQSLEAGPQPSRSVVLGGVSLEWSSRITGNAAGNELLQALAQGGLLVLPGMTPQQQTRSVESGQSVPRAGTGDVSDKYPGSVQRKRMDPKLKLLGEWALALGVLAGVIVFPGPARTIGREHKIDIGDMWHSLPFGHTDQVDQSDPSVSISPSDLPSAQATTDTKAGVNNG